MYTTPPIRTAEHSPAKKQLELSFGAEEAECLNKHLIPVAERSRYDGYSKKATHWLATVELRRRSNWGLVSCRSVQLVNWITPGLDCTSVSGEESFSPVAAKNLSENDFATAIEAARDVSYRQRRWNPLVVELRRGCTRRSALGICSSLPSCLSNSNPNRTPSVNYMLLSPG